MSRQGCFLRHNTGLDPKKKQKNKNGDGKLSLLPMNRRHVLANHFKLVINTNVQVLLLK